MISQTMHDQMLESNRDDLKLEAMRCVTVMTAKGKLSTPRALFPHIVKNVSSKNPELKKLIYLYLTSFADQEPDLALLPVATLQKSLKNPNPLIRSTALKVLTSMRLSILSAILIATIRNSVNDLSPYVRKTVAHAIIKIYRLEPNLRSDLIEYIERLFNDKNSMVISSVVASFEAVCPERLDLVHKHYRRFCFVLADCNEWGQTLLLNILMRYVIKTHSSENRSNFTNLNSTEHDPMILLRSAKPLIHSNNSAVVMAVIRLYIAIANQNEVRSTITKPLIRLLWSHREIQLCVLKMIENLITNEEVFDELAQYASDNHSEENKTGNEEKNVTESSMSCSKLELRAQESKIQELIEDKGKEILEQAIKEESQPSKSPEPTEQIDEHIMAKPNENHSDSNREGAELIEEKDGEKEIGRIQSKDNEKDVESASESDENDVEDEEDEDEDEEDEDEDEDEEDEDEDEDESEDEEEDEDVSLDGPISVNGVSNERSDSDKEMDLLTGQGIGFIDFKTKRNPEGFREVFRPYMKSFYIKYNDCTQIRLAKLTILTHLCSSENVTQVLRELQAYIWTYVDDREFVSAVIHAIGNCAIAVREVAHTCLTSLTSLLSNNNEHIVSEAIVVLRSQIISRNSNTRDLLAKDGTLTQVETINQVDNIMNGPSNDDDEESKSESAISSNDEVVADEKMVSTVIKQVTKLLPTVTAPQARATIIWILAEFCGRNKTAASCAPDVIRNMAKSFSEENNIVKLQILTLATKFSLTVDKDQDPKLYQKIQLLSGYLLSLAKYDLNHDVRDRGRFIKKLLEDQIICAKVLNVKIPSGVITHDVVA